MVQPGSRYTFTQQSTMDKPNKDTSRATTAVKVLEKARCSPHILVHRGCSLHSFVMRQRQEDRTIAREWERGVKFKTVVRLRASQSLHVPPASVQLQVATSLPGLGSGTNNG